MRITDKIYIDLSKESVSAHANAIADACTYDNPDYYKKMNLGLSLYGVPEKIQTFHVKDSMLEIMRGEAMKLKPYIGHLEYNFEHPDHPIKLQYINNDFDLDEYQEGAVQAIKGKRQGIVHAVTSAGKSLIILKSIVELGQRAVIIVHRKVLMQQILEDINSYIRDEKGEKIKVGIIGHGHFTVGDITIAIDKTLGKRIGELKDSFGTAVLDECHLAPANTISAILNSLNTRNRFGFSGTLKRQDQKEFLMFAVFGQVIHTITKEQLLEKKRVVPVEVRIITSDTLFDWDDTVAKLIEDGDKNPTVTARAFQDKTIATDPNRNEKILLQTSILKGKTLVLSRYVEPCYDLQKALRERYGIECGVITGADGKEALESYNAMKHQDLKVIFATIGCVSTGVSISDLDNIILITPIFTNELLLHQIRGRLMRTSEGKTHGTLYFVYDQYIYPESKLRKFKRIMEN